VDIVKRQVLKAAFCSYLLLFSFSLSLIGQEKQAEDTSSQGRAKAEKKTDPLLQARGRLQKIFQGQAPKDAHDVKAMQKHVQLLIEKLSPATVGVRVRMAQGSGVIINEEGLVLTAAHVIGRPGQKAIILMPDGKEYEATTLGRDRSMDAGMLKIKLPESEEERSKMELPFAEIAEADSVKPGHWCLALGHPGGFDEKRPPVVRLGRVNHKYGDVITTDCTLIGGDSGGPLFDMSGRVIGIHSRIGQQLKHNVHVPIEAYIDSWDRMASSESWGDVPGRPYIGIRGSEESTDPVVTEVIDGGPASKAGIQPGDVIIQFGEEQIDTFEALQLAVGVRRPGEKVKLIVQREDEKVELQVEVGELPRTGTSRERPHVLPVRANGYPGLIQYITMYRSPGVNERNHESIKGAFSTISAAATRATVRISEKKKGLALGVIVSEDGLIVTKASQVVDKEGELRDVICELSDKRDFKPKLIAVEPRHDIALLQIKARKLTVITWSDESDAPGLGSWLITTGIRETPLSIGVVSVDLTEVLGGVLGVQLHLTNPDSTAIMRVYPGSGGAEAGLKAGDVIIKVNGVEMKNRQMLQETVRSHLRGEEITLEIQRGEETMTIKAVLGRMSDITGGRPVVQNNLGGPLSDRRSGFPSVLQHDSVVQPNQCGGPVLDINGKAVGINIARAGRIKTYALPAEIIKQVVEQLAPK
jgi:serine protease Do